MYKADRPGALNGLGQGFELPARHKGMLLPGDLTAIENTGIGEIGAVIIGTAVERNRNRFLCRFGLGHTRARTRVPVQEHRARFGKRLGA